MSIGVLGSRLRIAGSDDREILKNLMQYYFYDFTEFIDINVEASGLFSDYPYLSHYWEEDGRYPYLIESEGNYSGFVLVRKVVENGENHWSIAEFFIMKKFRRSGIGEWAAHQVFDRHKGNWEVSQIEKNIPAQYFWRKVINDYTEGMFVERTEEGQVIQEFCN